VPRPRAVAALGLGVAVGGTVPALGDFSAELVAEPAEARVAVATRSLDEYKRIST
jgi:hypothetical protein